MPQLKTLRKLSSWCGTKHRCPAGPSPCSEASEQGELSLLTNFTGTNYCLKLGTCLNALSGPGSWINCRLSLSQYITPQRAPSHSVPTHPSLRGMLPWISTGHKRVHIGRTLLRLLGVNIDLTALPPFFFFKNRFVGHGWKNRIMEYAWFTLALTQTCRSVGWQLGSSVRRTSLLKCVILFWQQEHPSPQTQR